MAAFRGASGTLLSVIRCSRDGALGQVIFSTVKSYWGHGFMGAPQAAALDVIWVSLRIGRRARLGLA